MGPADIFLKVVHLVQFVHAAVFYSLVKCCHSAFHFLWMTRRINSSRFGHANVVGWSRPALFYIAGSGHVESDESNKHFSIGIHAPSCFLLHLIQSILIVFHLFSPCSAFLCSQDFQTHLVRLVFSPCSCSLSLRFGNNTLPVLFIRAAVKHCIQH